MKMKQLDGSVKDYGHTPWWMNEPMSKQTYRDSQKLSQKQSKVRAALSVVRECKESLRALYKGEEGVMIDNNPNIVIVLKRVGQKLERV